MATTTPEIHARLLARQLATGVRRVSELGMEKRCSYCGEYWPADREFFFRGKSLDGLSGTCKACYELRRARKALLADQTQNQSKLREPKMTHQEEYVLGLLRKQPGLRAMDIADKLDLDMDATEAAIASLKRGTQIVEEKQFLNGREITVYRPNPGFLGWRTDQPMIPRLGDVIEVEARVTGQLGAPAPAPEPAQAPLAAEPAEIVEQPAQADPAPAKPAKAKTKVQLAIDYLQEHGATDSGTLKWVMGLPNSGHPSTYLAAAIRTRRVVRIEDTYSLAPALQPAKPAAAPVAPPAPGSAASGQLAIPPVDLDQEFIDLLRLRLSPDEFRGYLKANVLEHTVLGRNSAEDYRRAGLFLDMLKDMAEAWHAEV